MKTLLAAAIDNLSQDYRAVFVLLQVEGLTTAETAKCLGVSEDGPTTPVRGLRHAGFVWTQVRFQSCTRNSLHRCKFPRLRDRRPHAHFTSLIFRTCPFCLGFSCLMARKQLRVPIANSHGPSRRFNLVCVFLVDAEDDHLGVGIRLSQKVCEVLGDSLRPRPEGDNALEVGRLVVFGASFLMGADTMPQMVGSEPDGHGQGITFERLVRDGVVKDYAEIARLTGLTRARVTQIVNLTLLAPDIQEKILLAQGERVSGSRRAPWGYASGSLVNRSRGRRKPGPGAGITGAVSRGTRAPTADATGAPQNARPDDSGLMMPGSPRDRNVRTPE